MFQTMCGQAKSAASEPACAGRVRTAHPTCSPGSEPMSPGHVEGRDWTVLLSEFGDGGEGRRRSSGVALAMPVVVIANGLTLAFFGVVVALLSVCACSEARSFVGRSDAMSAIGAVRLAEEAHRAEFGHYGSFSRNFEELCPQRPTAAQRMNWRPSCGTGPDGPWSRSTLRDPLEVAYGVAVVARSASQPGTLRFGRSTFPPAALSQDWYAIYLELYAPESEGGVATGRKLLATSIDRSVLEE